MRTWPASFALLAVSVAGVVGGSFWWLNRRCGWSRNDALLAALPGALSFVLAAAEDLKADMKKVAISQSMRLLFLVEAIPLAALVIGSGAAAPIDVPRQASGPFEIAALLAAGAACGYLLERLRVPGGWMLGGLLASAVLNLSGAFDASLPAWLVTPSLIALAAIGGSRFRPGDLTLLPAIAGPAAIAFAIAIAISLAGALAVSLLFGVDIVQTMLAFAPGALDTLTVIAYEMDIDPAYVAAHHVARFVRVLDKMPD
jgi:membrane AbrB-like protein